MNIFLYNMAWIAFYSQVISGFGVVSVNTENQTAEVDRGE